MSTSSLPAPDPRRRKKRFSLQLSRPSFRKSIRERPEADEIARVRKAAAWQWYTRGVADHIVVPTKRVPAAAAASSTAGRHNSNNGLHNVQRAKSRFKAEAASPGNHPSVAAAHSPLYDEFELSGLKSHMAEFVQRLQKQQEGADASTAANSGIMPAAKDEIKLNHKPPATFRPISSSFQRPLSAIHKFFRKISGAIKSSGRTNSPPISANHIGPVAPADDEMQYEYHHYIHHHHHHYHYGCSPEESFDMIRRRRHSESSGFRHTLGLWEAAVVDEEDPINCKASPRRRRHSESLSIHPMTRGSIDHEEIIGGPGASPLPRRHNSERFSTHNKMQGGHVEQHGVVVDDDDDEFITTSRIRRHSTESLYGTVYRHEAAAYKLRPPSPATVPPPRRHSESFDPSYRATNYDQSPSKAPRSPMLRQPPMSRRHFESLSERKFSVAPTGKANPGRGSRGMDGALPPLVY